MIYHGFTPRMRCAGVGALAALALLLPALTPAARAQFPTNTGQSSAQVKKNVNGKTITIPYRPSYVSLSPLTLFEIKDSFINSAGRQIIRKRNDLGPFVQYERHFPLYDNRGQPSEAVFGIWYWYHGSRDDFDRLAVYGQYFYTPQIGGQINLGGSTKGQSGQAASGGFDGRPSTPSGLYEYYGFLLYQPSFGHKSPFGLQLGAGPYIPRSSVGDLGYTFTLGGVYKLTDSFSLSASGWYVNYRAKNAGGSNTTDNLLRSQISVVYNFK